MLRPAGREIEKALEIRQEPENGIAVARTGRKCTSPRNEGAKDQQAEQKESPETATAAIDDVNRDLMSSNYRIDVPPFTSGDD